MARSSYLAASVLLMLSATASAMSRTDEKPQERVLSTDAHGPHARLATAGMKMEVETAEKKDGERDGAVLPMEGMPNGGGGVAIQSGDPGPVPSAGADASSSGAASGSEHGKEEGSGGSSKEGEKNAKSCLTKEECHKKRLICGKGCTLSAHAKCASKCSKSCVATC